jgi:hypothetical protein
MGRRFTDAQMAEFDRHVDGTDLSAEKKHAAKRTLRRMQGLACDEGTVDPAIADMLRRFARELA